MHVEHQITDPAKMLQFVRAGRAYFTVLNTQTNGRVTYCVETNEAGESVVRAFTGTENTNRGHYSYLGTISADGQFTYAGGQAAVDALLVAAEDAGDAWLVGFCKSLRVQVASGKDLSEKQQVALTKAIKKLKVTACALPATDVRVRGFDWIWGRLNVIKSLPSFVQFWHAGRCAKCARPLTVPTSIATGFGPECSELLGIVMVTEEQLAALHTVSA